MGDSSRVISKYSGKVAIAAMIFAACRYRGEDGPSYSCRGSLDFLNEYKRHRFFCVYTIWLREFVIETGVEGTEDRESIQLPKCKIAEFKDTRFRSSLK